jgi:membrane protein DedA with SNARE-associated domain
MSGLINNLVNNGGILAVFVLMAVESCGIPVPSELIMTLAGYLAFSGHLSLVAAIVAGAGGNLVGSLAAYALAARYGKPLLLGPGRRVGISPSHVEQAERWFDRHGMAAVFLGRMLPVIRTYISFPAGLARVEITRFSLLTFAGALPWCAALAIAGYEVGANYEKVSGPIEKLAIVIAVVIAGLLVAWIVRGRRRTA